LSPKPLYTESELIELLRLKSQRAYNYLYDNYSSAIYGVIYKIVADADESSDVMQEAFIKIWKNIERYDVDKGRLFTWMINIARNLAIDYIRSVPARNSSKTDTLTEATPLSAQEHSAYIKTDHMGLERIVNELATEQKIIIDLAYFQGYTQEEIAKELNMPLGTVKTRARAALMKLKRLFD
jgi:RNA polymerase sigma factor (sigma-70 family)